MNSNKRGRSLFKIDDTLLLKEIESQEKRINHTRSVIAQQEEELKLASDVKAFELMIPFSHLGKGKTFGELALQINKDNPHKSITRAATITCITKCQFATMSKQDYQAILAKTDQKIMDRMIDFLRGVSYMKFLTRQQLQKVVLGMQKQNHHYGQIVCSEGGAPTNLIIVGKGEY